MDVEKKAWLDRNYALRNLRFKRVFKAYYQVLQTDEALVKAIAAKRQNPPNPKMSFTYEGIAYVLQSYCNGHARYVRLENFNPEQYVFEHPDIVQRVRDEISISAEIIQELEILKEFFPELPIESL